MVWLRGIMILCLVVVISLNENTLLSQCATSSLTTTYAQNNGQDGIMFDIVAQNDVSIHCFDVNWDPGTFDYEVYYKSGSANGSEATAADWTLVGSGTGITSAGNGNPTAIAIDTNLDICAGTRAAFYITNTGGTHANLNYTNGTALDNVFASDANIEVREMFGKQYPFGSSYSPRVFNGTVYYNTISSALCSPLPVELVYFDAVNKQSYIMLTWQTAFEINNDYFTLERSVDAIEWEEIAVIDGAGNSTDEKNILLTIIIHLTAFLITG